MPLRAPSDHPEKRLLPQWPQLVSCDERDTGAKTVKRAQKLVTVSAVRAPIFHPGFSFANVAVSLAESSIFRVELQVAL
jgi:hypothetical protein